MSKSPRTLFEINFDGIVGPSHNYAGLSLGNLASARNASAPSFPRAAALQGLAKMRSNMALGLAQGFLLPHDRPNRGWLESIAATLETAPAPLRAAAYSASPMWTANAATVSPAPDTADGLCHLTVANLMTMPHRSHEWPQTLAQLRLAFADTAHFAVHEPVPPPFGDEGAANHMRLCDTHDAPGLELFVYGVAGGPFPARQHREACEAVARRHGLQPDRVLFLRQSDEAIAAGAFHNDVVAVANGRVLFTHEQAFADSAQVYADIRAAMPGAEIVEVPASVVSLGDAIRSYLFNAQLVTLPGDGGMALILPEEARETPAVWGWLEALVRGNGPIRKLVPVDVRQSMANGGGPACLRLRVVADPATVDPRFMATTDRLDRIAEVIETCWPQRVVPEDLAAPAFAEEVSKARAALLHALDLSELL